MAELAAVPGIDPSRVGTPDDLAACLNGLRRRRGLSYEVMADRAAKLASRSGRSRPEPLPKSTVGEIVTGKRLPTKGKLLTFLTVCEVAPADQAQWLAAWERARTVDLARPAGGVRVREVRPRLLGVHDAIQVDEEVPGELPVYVPRDIDDLLRAGLAANVQRGGFVLLIGGSSVGKTRTLYEAVVAALSDWWLVHPDGPDEVTALTQAPPPRTVVWLDELQRYLDGQHGLTGGTIRALLGGPGPVVLIGTLWPDRYATYTTIPQPGATADQHGREREVLDLATVIRVSPAFTPAEQDRARAAAGRDRRLALALGAEGYGLTQTLAAAPQLVDRWEGSRDGNPYAWAVLTAALDAARLGVRAPLTADLLRAAAPGYCTSAQQAEAPGNWFERALAYATAKLHGAAAALAPAGSGMGQIAGYTVADYLIQHASRERRYARPPASAWDALRSYIGDPADAARLAASAWGRLLYRYALPLYRPAADAGDRSAAQGLAALLVERGDLEELRARADAGDEIAAGYLAGLLQERGDLEELRARADGDLFTAFLLTDLLAERGDLEELRARADAGHEFAADRLAELQEKEELRARADAGDEDAARELTWLLIEREDLEELRARANAGDLYAAWGLAKELSGLLAERGDLEELRARADAGDRAAARRLAELQDLEEVRARADAGDTSAANRLAKLLAERADLEELRARADADDRHAALQLADLLAERGDLDEAAQILQMLTDAGHGNARQLAELLTQQGRSKEAERLRWFGLNPDGSIAYE